MGHQQLFLFETLLSKLQKKVELLVLNCSISLKEFSLTHFGQFSLDLFLNLH